MQVNNAPKQIVVATGNQHKMAEFRQLLGPRIDLRAQTDLLPSVLEVEEMATSFQGNALLKALAVHKAPKLATLADDSGICVRGLDMAPGIFTARYASPHSSDREKRSQQLQACKKLAGAELDE